MTDVCIAVPSFGRVEVRRLESGGHRRRRRFPLRLEADPATAMPTWSRKWDARKEEESRSSSAILRP
jgi:hypothetical protein